jgi:anti-anti-sigma factor
MNLKIENTNNLITIKLEGSFDLYEYPHLITDLENIIDENSSANILLNFEFVQYVSSYGLRIIMNTINKLQESDRRFMICNVNDGILKIFKILDLVDLFSVHENEEEAISSLLL